MSLLHPIVSGASEVFTDLATKSTGSASLSRILFNAPLTNDSIAKALKSSSLRPLNPIMNELRVFKSDSEIANMRKAGQISGRAFTNTMQEGWSYEKHLQAFLEFGFKLGGCDGGCDGSAYVPVVAGGKVSLFEFPCVHEMTNGPRMVA